MNAHSMDCPLAQARVPSTHCAGPCTDEEGGEEPEGGRHGHLAGREEEVATYERGEGQEQQGQHSTSATQATRYRYRYRTVYKVWALNR